MEAISIYLLGFRDLASNISVYTMKINDTVCSRQITCNRNLIYVQWAMTIPYSTLLFVVPALRNKICRNMLKWVSQKQLYLAGKPMYFLCTFLIFTYRKLVYHSSLLTCKALLPFTLASALQIKSSMVESETNLNIANQ